MMAIEAVPQLERHGGLLGRIRDRMLAAERCIERFGPCGFCRERLGYWSRHYVRLYLLCCMADREERPAIYAAVHQATRAKALLRHCITRWRSEGCADPGDDDPMSPFAYDADWERWAIGVDTLLAE
jgi:hypothetical protein